MRAATATSPPPWTLPGLAGRTETPEREAPATSTRSGGAGRVIAYAALASYAAVTWAGLLAHPPAGRILLVVGIAVAGAVALLGIGRLGLSRVACWALAMAAVLATVAAGAVAAGVPAALLLPGRWAELQRQLNGGIGALGDVVYPYRGGAGWSRTVLLGAMPLWLGLSAALSFWPARSGTPAWARLGGLIVLVAAFGIAVTTVSGGAPLLRGVLLAVLVAGWLWGPDVDRRHAIVAGALVVAAGLVAAPLAARIDGHHPWLDYRNWNWSWATADSGESFTWDHSYGPLKWTRTGAPMLQVRSSAPHYWRTAVLDQFDGLRWHESATSGNGAIELPVPSSRNSFPNEVLPLRRSWIHEMTFTIRGLNSQLLVGAGAVLSVHGLTGVGVEGLTGVAPTTSGLLLPSNSPLGSGDTYTVRAYIPDPTSAQMRAVPRRYAESLRPYTEVAFPTSRPVPAGPDVGVPPQGANPTAEVTLHQLYVPFWRPGAAPSSALIHSPYRHVYALTRQLTAHDHTAYGAVRSVERYLRANYAYREDVPARDYPLRAFLFQDRAGYCQQFSGAMALMLRMVGIPARVASGFSPGTPDNGSYLVRDFDAHSWVEVYFNRIGWVTFDPTPGAAPAQSRSTGLGNRSLNAPPAGKEVGGQVGAPLRRTRLPHVTPVGSGSSSAWPAVVGTALLLVAAGFGILGLRTLRARSLSPAARVDAQLAEFTSALYRLRSWRPQGATLLALERRLALVVGPAAAAYAAKLRTARYSRGEAQPASAAERREMRRELSSGSGLRGWALGVFAIPPGGALRH